MKNLLTSFFLLPSALCFGEITVIDSIEKLPAFFEEADSKTLGVFDIDGVLLISSEPPFQRPTFMCFRDELREMTQSLSHVQRDVLVNLINVSFPSKILEEKTSFILKELQSKRIPLIALTAASCGQLQGKNLADLRISSLKSWGIDFSSAFPEIEEIRFTELKERLGNVPSYKQGILFANGENRKGSDAYSKGEILIKWMTLLSFKPKKVIFIDDKRENVEEMESTLRTFDPSIEFTGIEFTGAIDYSDASVDHETFHKKWSALIEEAKKYEPDTKKISR
jgi:hypothetical protein